MHESVVLRALKRKRVDDMKHAMRFTVEPREVNDRNLKNMTLYALCNRLEQAAGESAATYNLSSKRLIAEGFAWALVKMCVSLESVPRLGDELILYTWPVGIAGIKLRRDYQLTDTQGNTLVRATSEWVVLSLAKRRAVRIPDFIVNAGLTYPEYAMDEPSYKLASTKNLAKCLPVLRVTHANADDIDINSHVNNVRYIKWIERALPSEIRIKSIEIVYKKEALLGDEITARGGYVTSNHAEYVISLFRGEYELVAAKVQ
jgi:acyl-ACP thioesterase